MLANSFAEFFKDKIDKIRHKFSDFAYEQQNVENESNPKNVFAHFSEVTIEHVTKVIRSMSNSYCTLDPAPTWLVKACLEELAPLITQIVNRSLATGYVPTALKNAIIKPILKHKGEDTEELKNYRPVSNLSFLSKVLEKVVAVQVERFIVENDLNDTFQSAYKQCYSTETALLKVSNDIMHALDRNQQVYMVNLDLSAAFDTVDHNILISRLETVYKFESAVLSWFVSYLSSRTQSVMIDHITSSAKPVTCGVPQGSVLGPRLYTMYVQPLAAIIVRHNIQYHGYADDLQLYISTKRDAANTLVAIRSLENCVTDIAGWMHANHLKLNDSKTNFICFSSAASKASSIGHNTIRIIDSTIKASDSVKNLGCTLDKHMLLKEQVMRVCSASNYHLRNIARIKKYLTQDVLRLLVQAFVASRLDYCNSLYYGLPGCVLKRLQLVQNRAARIVTNTANMCHITPVLKELHWLPLEQRVTYKIASMVHKSCYGFSPDYIDEALVWHQPTRGLRSGERLNVTPSRKSTVRYGERTIPNMAAHSWNGLPDSLKECENATLFKKGLKTHLFRKYFDC